MFNITLYKRELRASWRMLLIFALILALYIVIIIVMYDSRIQETLDSFVDLMPTLMESVGMRAGTTGMLAYLSSYLYGFILLLFPLVYATLTANRLVARYVERGSMAALLSAPVKRRTLIQTQMIVQVTGIVMLVIFITVLELMTADAAFSGVLDRIGLLRMNMGLLVLHLFIGALSFFFSCLFSDSKNSLTFGTGMPVFMYILTMLSKAGKNTAWVRFFTFFSFYDPDGLINLEAKAIQGVLVLALGTILFYAASIIVFTKKDLSI